MSVPSSLSPNFALMGGELFTFDPAVVGFSNLEIGPRNEKFARRSRLGRDANQSAKADDRVFRQFLRGV